MKTSLQLNGRAAASSGQFAAFLRAAGCTKRLTSGRLMLSGCFLAFGLIAGGMAMRLAHDGLTVPLPWGQLAQLMHREASGPKLTTLMLLHSTPGTAGGADAASLFSQRLVLTATLMTSDGKPVGGRGVSFYRTADPSINFSRMISLARSGNSRLGTATTNSSGIASVAFQAPGEPFKLRAGFDGDTHYAAVQAMLSN